MENASKALLMAGGVLLGVLILALMVTLFASASGLSKTYEETKQSEAIQQFNSNFTKYLGKKLTTHEVVTICNFASIDNNKVKNVDVEGGKYIKEQENDISTDLEAANKEYNDNIREYGTDKKVVAYYTMKIEKYDASGYISQISFSNRNLEAIEIK